MPKRPKTLILYSSPVVLIGAVALFAMVEAGRLQSDAERLATTGQAAIQVLKEVAASLYDSDLDRALASYSEHYEDPEGGFWSEQLRSDRDGVRVYDWQVEDAQSFGKAEMREQLSRLLDRAATWEKVKFKLHSVEESPTSRGGDTVVRATLVLRGTAAESSDAESSDAELAELFESHLTFRIGLSSISQEAIPSGSSTRYEIHRQQLLSGETVRGRRQGFTDVARQSGIDFRSRLNPRFATPEWEPKTFSIIKYGASGVSAPDFDGDGWDDLFFGDGLHPRLYRNTAGDAKGAADEPETGLGPFVDVTREVGLPDEISSVNLGLFADFDNDGDQDLMVTRFMEGSLLYRNDGDAETPVRFVDVTEDAGLGRGFVTVAATADYDLDGDLDIYIGRYLDPRVDLPTTLFYTRNGQGNSLLRNDGDLRFTDVTDEAGVRDGGLTLGVAWGDVDQDGDPDLYVANDFGRNALLRNDGDGGFTDISAESGAIDFGFGMSSSFGDPDNDGDLDIYVSNVHSGQRWYGQAATLHQYLLNSFKQRTILEDFPIYREIYGYAGADWRHYGDRMVKGNSLLMNDGEDGFRDVAEDAGANPFGWYWGSAFLDYDNDGRQDIYAANGWISGETTDDL